ncbi:hypothetical protein DL96DRAFT_1717815 [Flagelloscypha sp. PMI_526]|nr:hypothetical protein DL96DRAFT_1717815 [Flagelloscypha sp. PMI_526]
MTLHLSEDVLTEIVHFLHDVDRSSILPLSIVSRNFHLIVLPFIYRECRFDLTKSSKPEELERLRKWTDADSELAWVPSTIRQVTLHRKPSTCPPLGPEVWTPFLELIPHMNNLYKFVFSVHAEFLPAALLKALEAYTPLAHLVVEHWHLKVSDITPEGYLDRDQEALIRSSLLREIHTVDYYDSHDVTFIGLRRVVSLAPNLKKISVCEPEPVEIDLEDFICGYDSDDNQDIIAAAKQRLILPTLGKHTPLRPFSDLEFIGAPAYFVEYCMKIVDPAHLERLEMWLPISSNTSILEPLRFPALRELSLYIIRKAPPCMGTSLESFTLRSDDPIPKSVLSEFLDTHGPTLKSPVLRNDLSPRGLRQGPTFSPIRPDSILLIRNKCPSLEQLYLCAGRTNDFMDGIDVLSTFSSRLRHITLDFGAGIGFSYIHPRLIRTTPPEIPHMHSRLELLDAEIEEWEQKLWLHMPLTTSTVEKMFGRIFMAGSGALSLETLVVKIQHPWANGFEQEFLVQRRFGETGLKTTVMGYEIPAGEEASFALDADYPRLKRLEKMWMRMRPDEVFPLSTKSRELGGDGLENELQSNIM